MKNDLTENFKSFMSSGSPLALYSENNKHGTGVMLSKTRTEPVILKYKFWLTQFTA